MRRLNLAISTLRAHNPREEARCQKHGETLAWGRRAGGSRCAYGEEGASCGRHASWYVDRQGGLEEDSPGTDVFTERFWQKNAGDLRAVREAPPCAGQAHTKMGIGEPCWVRRPGRVPGGREAREGGGARETSPASPPRRVPRPAVRACAIRVRSWELGRALACSVCLFGPRVLDAPQSPRVRVAQEKHPGRPSLLAARPQLGRKEAPSAHIPPFLPPPRSPAQSSQACKSSSPSARSRRPISVANSVRPLSSRQRRRPLT